MLARAALVVVTILWGSTFAVVHAGLDSMSPLVIVAGRFGLAALTIKVLFRRARLVRAALPLGAANFVAIALQTTGLMTTMPSRSAFITALSVVFVPLAYPLVGKRLPRARVLLAAAFALIGVYILFRPIGSEWTVGDSLTLACAALYTYYVLELGRLSREHSVKDLVLTQCLFASVAAIAVASIAVALGRGGARLDVSVVSVAAIAYLGLACTAVTFALMAWGQSRVEPTTAAVIYTLEPVWAAAVSVLIGREAWSWALATGGALILMAMLLTGGEPDP